MSEDYYQEEESSPTEPVGRTVGDLVYYVSSSNLLKGIIILTIALIAFYFFRDDILRIPLYIPLSIAASFLWYRPMLGWFSEQATYIDLYDDDTNTWTTFRIGKEALYRLNRSGMNNTYHSLYGNERIFASALDPSEGVLETMWIHDADMWTYHTERKTLAHLSSMLNDSLKKAFDSEATSQAEGRRMAAEAMRKHYAQLDSIFFGDVSIEPSIEEPNDEQ